MQLSLDTIISAHKRIKPYIINTPIKSDEEINQLVGADIYFKCENMQNSGSFKFRGASNAIFSLNDKQADRGVITVSSGNHGTALSLAAKNRGINATVILPSNATPYKRNLIDELGANIIECEPTVESREKTLLIHQKKTQATVIHPYNDYQIMSGQGTISLEIIDEITDLDIIMFPIGGGGLISGNAVAINSISPKTDIIGAEPELANDAQQSLQNKKLIPSTYPETVADGLRTSLGSKAFPIILKYIKNIYTTPEEKIIPIMNLMSKKLNNKIEPSCAVPLAAILENISFFKGKRIAIVISGGNISET
ncbi:MAG: pyridoxal-phosphate dependent enzyme [Candidatus Marinimicrobia bacterium]|nr:pyridoxal-phosphate dependent enzyme [Candidatus Neomarinimicrobiota bacterium]